MLSLDAGVLPFEAYSVTRAAATSLSDAMDLSQAPRLFAQAFNQDRVETDLLARGRRYRRVLLKSPNGVA